VIVITFRLYIIDTMYNKNIDFGSSTMNQTT